MHTSLYTIFPQSLALLEKPYKCRNFLQTQKPSRFYAERFEGGEERSIKLNVFRVVFARLSLRKNFALVGLDLFVAVLF